MYRRHLAGCTEGILPSFGGGTPPVQPPGRQRYEQRNRFPKSFIVAKGKSLSWEAAAQVYWEYEYVHGLAVEDAGHGAQVCCPRVFAMTVFELVAGCKAEGRVNGNL